MSIPKTQQAWQQVSKGTPATAIKLNLAAPVPVPTKEDVLVKVRNVAFNPVGYKMMGTVPGFIRKLPTVLEFDLSGAVVDANGHSQFSNGQEVFGIVPIDESIKLGRGAMAQYVLVKAVNLTPKPASLPFDQAAGIPLAGMTAYGALFTKGNLKAGDRVLINGGSTSVGRFAIQLAKLKGIYVVTTCSSRSKAAVARFGPDEIVTYDENPIPQHLINHYPIKGTEVKGFHLIIDAVGTKADLFTSSPRYLLPGRPFLALAPEPNVMFSLLRPTILGGTNRPTIIYLVKSTNEALRELAQLAGDGKLIVDIDGGKANGWDEASIQECYERMQSGKAQGKIIVEVPQ